VSAPPRTIVDWFEANKTSGEPLILSEPSKTWVDRMWHAMIDNKTTTAAFNEIDRAFIGYLDALDEDERFKTEAVFMFFAELARDCGDTLPKCVECGSILCPHCGRHGARHDEEDAS
jgi:hypothetical protein